MVASLTDLGSSAMTVAYFEREGYYARNDPRQRRASFWHGAAARALGLPRQVSPKTFECILGGYVPGTEIRLGRARGGTHEHRPGLDLTLSAPKSVSLEALVYGNRQVLAAHDAAVRATLDWVEAELLQTRGYDPATGRRPRVAAHGLVAAGFRHLTSRDQDPQLHTHCILANMTRDRSGRWRSLEPTRIRRNVKLAGAYYRQELARRLIGLGYRIEATMIGGVPGFEIAGYPRALLDAFSSRRREILAWLEAHGLPWSAALTQQAALITRKRKAERDLGELRAGWKARAEKIFHDRALARQGRGQDGRRPRESGPARGRPYARPPEALRPEPAGLSVREVVWRAVEHLAERASVFAESEVRAIALSHAPGRHELAAIDAAVSGLLADGHLVEAATGGGRRFVTGEALRSERAVLARMRAGIGAGEVLAAEQRVSERLERSALTAGQREAVRTILLSRDRIVAVQGAAGTGKTTMLREALGLMGGRPVILLAPSAAAVRVLAGETGGRARTLQWFLTRHGDLGDAEKMANARRMHAGSVLVLDESSMTSTAQMELLMRISERLGVARLVLVGDRGQLPAVSAGAPFRALQEAGIATAEMDEILRQRDPGLKRAVEALQQGRPAEGLRGLGEVREVAQEELGAEAARLWLALDERQRAQTAILAPTHFIRAEIHRAVRRTLAREGVLHGPELEIERYVDRHLTAAQRADVRNHEAGDYVIFHARVPPLRVDKDEACRIAGAEGEFVFLEHPSGRRLRIRPGDNWVRYRFGIFETARIRIRAGDRVRWTRNDERHGLVNGGEAVVLKIGARRVRFALEGGKVLSLARGGRQLHHLDHAWSMTVHAAQGMTRDAAIGVLDSGHGRLAGQAGLYVEASRARDRFVLVTDNRERLEEALEENDSLRMTAREAVGEEDAPAGREDAAAALLGALRDDWRALGARARAQGREPAALEGYARIVTGVRALAEAVDLPEELRGFAAEVLSRDAGAVERRRAELAFLQKVEMHRRRQPLLRWAARERGLAMSELPEHAAWLAEGKALARAGRRMGEGFAGRIAAALGRIAQSFRLDAAWRAGSRAPAPEAARYPGHEEADRRIEAFLRDCRRHLDEAGPPAGEPERRLERLEALRREGLRWLGEAEGAKLDDPVRVRLAAAPREREEVREAVEALGDEARRLRAGAFMELLRSVERQSLEEGCDPADLPAWEALRARAEALRGEAGLAPEVREAVDTVLAGDARAEAGLARVRALLTAADAHLRRRAALEREESEREPGPSSRREAVAALREASRGLRETARALLGDLRGDAQESRAAARLAGMPRLRVRVREALERLEAVALGDEAADFRRFAARVEARARRGRTLPLDAEGYARATAMAEALAKRAALPEAPAREVTAWLERDRTWEAQMAKARELSGARGEAADPARRREAADLPAVAAAIRRETARLASSPMPRHGKAWTGDEPLVAGDRLAWRAGAKVHHAVVVDPGAAGGLRASDRLRLATVRSGERPRDKKLPEGDGTVEVGARVLMDARCVRAEWSDEGFRRLEVARQHSVPGGACRTACPEPVEGDRVTWTEAAGRHGEVRTVEAVATTRTRTPAGHDLELRVVRAEGPGAPEPGDAIRRSAHALTARGCYRAEWTDEARRASILGLAKQVHESRRHQRSRGRGLSM